MIRLRALTLVLVLAPLTAQASADLPGAIDGCIEGIFKGAESVDRDSPVDLSSTCPGLVPALRKSSLLRALEPSLDQDATLAQLLDAKAALTVPAMTSPRYRLDHAALPSLLHNTLQSANPDQAPSLWQRFKAWLAAKMKTQDSDGARWLSELLQNIDLPEKLVLWIFRISATLLILTALFIIFNEARFASWKGWWRRLLKRKHAAGRAGSQSMTHAAQRAWGDIIALPPARQAAALFDYVVRLLDRNGVLQARRSQTNGDYAARLHAIGGPLIGPFSELASGADLGMYGPDGISEARVEHLRDNVRIIRKMIEARP